MFVQAYRGAELTVTFESEYLKRPDDQRLSSLIEWLSSHDVVSRKVATRLSITNVPGIGFIKIDWHNSDTEPSWWPVFVATFREPLVETVKRKCERRYIGRTGANLELVCYYDRSFRSDLRELEGLRHFLEAAAPVDVPFDAVWGFVLPATIAFRWSRRGGWSSSEHPPLP